MIKITKLKVNFIVLIFLISIFIIINNFVSTVEKKDFNQISNSINLEITEDSNNSNEIQKDNIITDYEWQIEIPAISLKAEISEGTEKQVMDKYVGHFTETSITDGNVGLAAHNRGYEVNYFANIKNLEENDEIIYKYKDYKKIYKVKNIKIIEDTNWDYLQNTKENVITLITCVENQPECRRCIQAIESEEIY